MECAIFLWPISRLSIFFLQFDHSVLGILKQNKTKLILPSVFWASYICILVSFLWFWRTSSSISYAPFSFPSPFGILITGMFDGLALFHTSWLLCSNFFTSFFKTLGFSLSNFNCQHQVHYFFFSAILSLWRPHQRYSHLYYAVYFCHHYFNHMDLI